MKALIGGAVGALVGMIVWALVMVVGKVEIGILAWVIGGMVGFTTVFGGGRGMGGVLVAVAMTAVSICGGKIIGSQYQMGTELDEMASTELDEMLSEALSPEVHQEAAKDAADFAKLTSPSQYPEFMVTHGFTEVTKASEVSKEELAYFTMESVPELKNFHAKPMPYEEWKAVRKKQFHDAVSADFSMYDHLKGTMGILDIVFFLLGVATAAKVVAGNGGEA